MEFQGSRGGVRPIPRQRVLDRLDGYLNRRDLAAARRHLLYWLEEARAGGDLRGELLIRNELVGHYRKAGEREPALEHAAAALDLVDRLELGDDVGAAATYVNAATAMNAFGENVRALELFERAKALYEAGDAAPELLGGLYNNMALACAALGRFDEARALYAKALSRMAGAPHGELECAITCLNLADLERAELGMEAAEGRVYALADRAVALLDDPKLVRDGYYAFVCEKCAPTLEYYGYFDDARRLREEAERIYAGA